MIHLFTEALKKEENKKNSFQKLLDPKHKIFRKEKMAYYHRLNSLYTCDKIGNLLDSGEIDFAILDVLLRLKKYGLGMFLAGRHNIHELHERPIF